MFSAIVLLLGIVDGLIGFQQVDPVLFARTVNVVMVLAAIVATLMIAFLINGFRSTITGEKDLPPLVRPQQKEQ